MTKKPIIGVIGAGKLGITLTQLAIKAGYTVYIAGSGDVKKIALSVEILTPGAIATTTDIAIQKAHIIILALPLAKFRVIPANHLEGKCIIDAMNYWWEVDGARESILGSDTSTSEAVQEHFANAHVVKAFNHIGYHDLHDFNRPQGAEDRKAMAFAGDDAASVNKVRHLIDDLGFDPLYIGSLDQGKRLETGTDAFGAAISASKLKKLL